MNTPSEPNAAGRSLFNRMTVFAIVAGATLIGGVAAGSRWKC